ncbi:MAG TPA: peptidoglycan-binding protein [Acidimicrobiales bacterium]|jgi:peptidoglycan hydrolase-like protein with peptidoglycan-binding domain
MRATIQLGSHGDDVERVQRYFVRARTLDPTHLDGDFGPETDGLVRGFQQDNGLVVDGIVGPQTWGALPPYLEASPRLAEGDLGSDVARLQLALSRTVDAGYSGPIDGWFGPQTAAAVRAFQVSWGLAGSGVVDEQTWYGHVGAAGATLEDLAGMLIFDPFAASAA